MPRAKTIPSDPVSIIDEPSLKSSRVITAAETARLFQCSVTHAYDLMNARKIRPYKDAATAESSWCPSSRQLAKRAAA
jgi:hypothetical protein